MDSSIDEAYKQGLIYQRALKDSKPRWAVSDGTSTRLPKGERLLYKFKNMLNTEVLDKEGSTQFLIGNRESQLVEGYGTGIKTLNELLRTKTNTKTSLMDILHRPREWENGDGLYEDPKFKSLWLTPGHLTARIESSENKDLYHILIDGQPLTGVV